MAKGRVQGAPKRTTRIPARGTTLEACDRLLAAAKEQHALYELLSGQYAATNRIHWHRRHTIKTRRFTALVRYMQAVTAAQELNKKGRYIER